MPKPFSTLDAVVLDIPQKAAKLKERGPSEFVFRVIQSDKVYGSMALNDAELAPGTTTCVLYNSILGPEDVPIVSFGDTWSLQQDGKDAPLTFASVAEAEAFMQTQEYKDIKRMLISLELRSVKKPVEWKSYTSANGLGTFEYPDNWTIAEPRKRPLFGRRQRVRPDAADARLQPDPEYSEHRFSLHAFHRPGQCTHVLPEHAPGGAGHSAAVYFPGLGCERGSGVCNGSNGSTSAFRRQPGHRRRELGRRTAPPVTRRMS